MRERKRARKEWIKLDSPPINENNPKQFFFVSKKVYEITELHIF